MFVMFMSVIDPVWNGIEIIETLIKSIQKDCIHFAHEEILS